MDRPTSPLTLTTDAPELAAAVATAGRCLDAWHDFVGAVVGRPVTVDVRFGPEAGITGTDTGLTITVPGSAAGDPDLPYVLLQTALDAVEEAGRRWPRDRTRRRRGGTPAEPDGYATDRTLAALATGEMLLLAGPDDGDTVDDYLEERLAEPGIAEPADRGGAPGVSAWVLAPLEKT